MVTTFEKVPFETKFSMYEDIEPHYEKVENRGVFNAIDLNSGELLNVPAWCAIYPEAWFKEEETK